VERTLLFIFKSLFSIDDAWVCSTPSKNIIPTDTQSCQTSPVVGVLIDLGPDPHAADLTKPDLDVPEVRPSSPEKTSAKKLRRSVRLSCLTLPEILPGGEEEDTKQKRKLRRSMRLSCMELPDFLRTKDEEPEFKTRRLSRRSCLPKFEDKVSSEVSSKKVRLSMSAPAPQFQTEPRKLRRSMRLSSLNLPKFEDICSAKEHVVEEPVMQIEDEPEEPKRVLKKRKSIGPEILEEKLFHDSPSAGTAQEKHNRRMLELINTECTKVLQQLPTVGPKTGYVIYSYR